MIPRSPGIEQEEVNIEGEVNLAVHDEHVTEKLAVGPEVIVPGGQKGKAEVEATQSEVAEVSKGILDLGDVLCEAFKMWKEVLGLVKSKPDEESEDRSPMDCKRASHVDDDGETPELRQAAQAGGAG